MMAEIMKDSDNMTGAKRNRMKEFCQHFIQLEDAKKRYAISKCVSSRHLKLLMIIEI